MLHLSAWKNLRRLNWISFLRRLPPLLCRRMLASHRCGSAYMGSCVNPPLSMTILPLTSSLNPRWQYIFSFTVLFALFPHSVVLSTVCPGVNSEAVLLIIVILSLIHSAVFPTVHPLSMHIIVKPPSLVASSIWPDVLAMATDLIIHPVPLVATVIAPQVFAVPMLHASVIRAVIAAAVLPDLSTLSVLQIMLPISLIPRSVNMCIGAVSMGLVLCPFSVEDIAICMPELAWSVGFIVQPIAFVLCSIRPNLNSYTMSMFSFPLPFINRSIVENVLWPELKLGFLTATYTRKLAIPKHAHVIRRHLRLVVKRLRCPLQLPPHQIPPEMRLYANNLVYFLLQELLSTQSDMLYDLEVCWFELLP